jgi:hypothetical protein
LATPRPTSRLPRLSSRRGSREQKAPYGDGKVERFEPVNVHQPQHLRERNGRVLAQLIEGRTKSLLDSATKYRESLVIEYHFGPMDLTEWLSYCLTHF